MHAPRTMGHERGRPVCGARRRGLACTSRGRSSAPAAGDSCRAPARPSGVSLALAAPCAAPTGRVGPNRIVHSTDLCCGGNCWLNKPHVAAAKLASLATASLFIQRCNVDETGDRAGQWQAASTGGVRGPCPGARPRTNNARSKAGGRGTHVPARTGVVRVTLPRHDPARTRSPAGGNARHAGPARRPSRVVSHHHQSTVHRPRTTGRAGGHGHRRLVGARSIAPPSASGSTSAGRH